MAAYEYRVVREFDWWEAYFPVGTSIWVEGTTVLLPDGRICSVENFQRAVDPRALEAVPAVPLHRAAPSKVPSRLARILTLDLV
jgi:hypothetical protein